MHDNKTAARATAAALALTISASAAWADFRGAGAVFGYSDCAPVWGPDTVSAVRVRYDDTAVSPGLAASQVTIAFASGTFHYALWQRSFEEIGNFFLGGAGRSTFTRFNFATNRPQIRTVQRRVVTRINPEGPATIENAASIVLRLRIQNFADIPGCAATIAATMYRN